MLFFSFFLNLEINVQQINLLLLRRTGRVEMRVEGLVVGWHWEGINAFGSVGVWEEACRLNQSYCLNGSKYESHNCLSVQMRLTILPPTNCGEKIHQIVVWVPGNYAHCSNWGRIKEKINGKNTQIKRWLLPGSFDCHTLAYSTYFPHTFWLIFLKSTWKLFIRKAFLWRFTYSRLQKGWSYYQIWE